MWMSWPRCVMPSSWIRSFIILTVSSAPFFAEVAPWSTVALSIDIFDWCYWTLPISLAMSFLELFRCSNYAEFPFERIDESKIDLLISRIYF